MLTGKKTPIKRAAGLATTAAVALAAASTFLSPATAQGNALGKYSGTANLSFTIPGDSGKDKSNGKFTLKKRSFTGRFGDAENSLRLNTQLNGKIKGKASKNASGFTGTFTIQEAEVGTTNGTVTGNVIVKQKRNGKIQTNARFNGTVTGGAIASGTIKGKISGTK